jgi:hypothetical protein
MKIEEFKKELRTSLQAICNENKWSFDNAKQRGMAFEDWCFNLLSERYPAADNDPSQCIIRGDDAGTKLAARRDPRLFLPPVLETLAHVALGQIDAAKMSLISARRLRPELTLREIEISHGRRAVKALADLWTEAPLA